MKTTYTNNNKTIELTNVSPAHEKQLKDNGFSYTKARKCWYALNTPKHRSFVLLLEGIKNDKTRALALLKLGKGKILMINK